MIRQIAIFFIATSAFLAGARAQNASTPSTPATAAATCPMGRDMTHQHLQGRWLATLEGSVDETLMTLRRSQTLRLPLRINDELGAGLVALPKGIAGIPPAIFGKTVDGLQEAAQ